MPATVTVFGSSQPKAGEELYQTAYALGRALAQAGYALCNGGYGGTMEAAARGAREAGGRTLGVTCSLFGRSGPNAYMDRVIQTDDLFHRLRMLVEQGDAYVVLPGGSGTLVELALAWELCVKKLIPQRPVILYGEYWRSTVEMAARERPKSARFITIVHSPDEVVRALAAAGV